MIFPIDYPSILERIATIDPLAYGRTRNFEDGAVTRLSPYISRGVISTRMVFESVMQRGYRLDKIEKFVQELCWRDYFQRIAQERTSHFQFNDPTATVPTALLRASTGIEAVDRCIEALYDTGYMHNHMRMYVASIATNIAGLSWQGPARWMYFHLLDADFASNNGSWRWVCGAGGKKKYYANQENINRYFNSRQKGSMLDHDYDVLERMSTPAALAASAPFETVTPLPQTPAPVIKPSLPILVYTAYNLDPQWHPDEDANRILLLDPEHFRQFPMSEKSISFILALARNIPDLQVCTASFEELKRMAGDLPVYYKEHPLNTHYQGVEEARDWIAPQVCGFFPSFFAYWKQVVRHL
jgi:deoxyribodipyrimidine photo-lyase